MCLQSKQIPKNPENRLRLTRASCGNHAKRDIQAGREEPNPIRGIPLQRQRPPEESFLMRTEPPKTETREVMDIRQASDYLGISPDTLYKYASEGFVPAFKLGNRWRFKRSRLDEWMDRRSTPGMQPELSLRQPNVTQPKKPQSVQPRHKKTVRAIR